MTEERINSAAGTILRAASIAITKGILRTIADEARAEGREELREELRIKMLNVLVKQRDEMIEHFPWLKEQG